MSRKKQELTGQLTRKDLYFMLPQPKTVFLMLLITVHGLRSLEIVGPPNKSKPLIRQLRTLLATSGKRGEFRMQQIYPCTKKYGKEYQ
jgi:hypothetical protein